MYGFFNHAFEKFIIQKYGEEKWDIIRMEAGVFEESFDDKTVYDDNMIYEILDAASEVLDIETEELQELFGETYFRYCLHSHHGTLLSALGGNLYDFLSNIDSLHDHLSLSYAGVMIPTFRVTSECWGRSICVCCYSDRGGLEYVTKGVIRAAAQQLFNTIVHVQTVVDVNVFKFLITADDTQESYLMFPKAIDSPRDLIPQANYPKVSPLEFTKAFPFHMVFDRNMLLLQLGATLKRILKEKNSNDITTYFKLSRPQINFDFDSIYSRLNNAFVLTSLNDVIKPNALQLPSDSFHRRTNLRLKGEMIYVSEPVEVMLFLCSPSVSNIQDMRNKGLCLSDIPIHDATRDLVLLSENFQKELEMTHQLGIVNDHLQKIHAELEEEMNLYDRLLFDVLPPVIAKELRQFNPVPTEKFHSVTLMFTGIVDFTKLCENLDPFDIVSMLNEIYTTFDTLVDYLSTYVYKVETIGDKYMAVSGLPEMCSKHAQVMCSLVLDMVDTIREMNINKQVAVTFGIHSGEVVAGVIGQRMPRYCLFGNAVNLTSRTETTGVKGKINVTQDTYKLLQEDPELAEKYAFKIRGEVQMKGRVELMTTYILERPAGKTKLTSTLFSDERFSCSANRGGNDGLIAGKERLTLNRSRRAPAKRRNNYASSNYACRSRSTSMPATPFRSRCNSGRSGASSHSKVPADELMEQLEELSCSEERF